MTDVHPLGSAPLRGPRTESGGSRADLLSGAAYLIELGWTESQALEWLTHSARLARLPVGSAAARMARAASAGAAGSSAVGPIDALRAQVYGELETLERQSRAGLLGELALRLARSAASIGAAGLGLLCPVSDGGRDELQGRMAREGRRARSQRLVDVLGAVEEQESEPRAAGEPTPGAVAALLSEWSENLWFDDASVVNRAEVALAFEGPDAARSILESLGLPPETADSHAEPAPCDVPEGEPGAAAQAALEDRIERLLVLVDYCAGRAHHALVRMNAIPLLLDRSAPMGALRAAAEYHCAGTTGGAGLLRDEFVKPVDADERRRIARFLALAHGVPR